MLPRFLVPALDAGESIVSLPEDEAHHLHRVLRLQVGDDVIVFDGRGTDFTARVASVGRRAATVQLVRALPPSPAPAVALTLVQAVLKPDAMDAVVRDCAMVGVDAIQPVVSRRTAVKASMVLKGGPRWERVALAAAKQSGRSTLPAIAAPVALEAWLRRAHDAPVFLLLEPSAALPGIVRVRQLAQRAPPLRASLLVGPEGGWTADERDLAIAEGCIPLSLGRLTLRAEAVPLAAAAALLAVWDA